MGASSSSGHANLLLERGAGLNSASNDGNTALMGASNNGHVEVANLGAGLNSAATDGYTALMRASFNGHVEVVHLLLERGADLKTAANDGFTALGVAALTGHTHVAHLLLKACSAKNCPACWPRCFDGSFSVRPRGIRPLAAGERCRLELNRQ